MSSNPPHALYISPRQSSMAPQSPMKSPVRRVLGELTPNARASPVIARDDIVKTPTATSPLKKAGPVTPADILSEKHRLEEEAKTRWTEGKKRPLDTAITAVAFKKRRRTESWTAGERTSLWVTQDTTVQPPLSLHVPSDGSTTEENTPEPEPSPTGSGLRPSLEATAVKGSFSSLIDYDPSNASDKSQRPSLSPPADHHVEVVETNLKSQVELLRLRLRVAMYKVRTNQTDVPLSHLKVVDNKPSDPTGETIPPAEPNNSAALSVKPVSIPSAKRVEQSKSRSLGLLPAPILRPTAYSSRFINSRVADITSSPPSGSASPRKDLSVREHSLPTTRVSSPVKARAHVTPMASRVIEVGSEENLTSSVVKGRAASGLLELMRAR
ncbi:hypothetical protein NA57DRAFT_53342 [Rhizodiscina lignyota]|uniref:Uncharacterized protein n=1 Tax=Rhizodiscina lignyota TaxID=1504668 RepID=A0A9P4ILD3_9PEZI|nr:hypothetical protein NA57DRAFT_53342 [Rhizodiscina lignyota]